MNKEMEELKKAFDELDSSYVDLQEQNKHYREALEFYADRDNYKLEHIDSILDDYMSTVDYDEGITARKALEKNTMTDKEQIEDIKRKLEKDSRDSINRWWD